MSISKVESSELVEIIYLARVCSIEMNSVSSLYWSFYNQQFPNLIETGNVYKYRFVESTIGIIVFNSKNAPEYDTVNWECTHGNILPVRILVHPKWQDKEVGKELLLFAEQYAIDHNYNSIHIDVFTNNSYDMKIMEQNQYKKAGEILLPFHSAPFVCFEKQISKT